MASAARVRRSGAEIKGACGAVAVRFAVLGPGTLVDFGAELRKPVDRIHWAGTETSTYWNGYMDGAVRSGKRAAAGVLVAL